MVNWSWLVSVHFDVYYYPSTNVDIVWHPDMVYWAGVVRLISRVKSRIVLLLSFIVWVIDFYVSVFRDIILSKKFS